MTENRKTKIKICGLSRAEDIGHVNKSLPDYCGFIIEVPFSRRSVTVSGLRELKSLLCPQIQAVGVFVNAPESLVIDLLNEGVIDIAQLHGQETENYISRIREKSKAPIWKAFSISDEADCLAALQSSADMVILDHGRGGTGSAFDWDILKRTFQDKERRRPFILAGGLTAENIPHVIQTYHPWGIDLSSSVETDGKKDKDKIMAAVAAVRSANI